MRRLAQIIGRNWFIIPAMAIALAFEVLHILRGVVTLRPNRVHDGIAGFWWIVGDFQELAALLWTRLRGQHDPDHEWYLRYPPVGDRMVRKDG